MKIELLKEKLKGIHAHDTASVRVWDVMACPFCDAANGFVGGCYAVMDYLKTGVLQCRADFRHAAWVSGTGYANMVDLKFHESEILIHPTIVPADKLAEIMKVDKQPEGIVFKANNPYYPHDGGQFVKINPIDESGSIGEAGVMKISAATLKKFKDVMKGYVYSPKIDGHPYTNPCLEVQLPLPVEKITVTLTVKPKAYPMPLANPKSAWGKRMAEKLAQKS